MVLGLYISRAFWGKNVVQFIKKGKTEWSTNLWGSTIKFAKIIDLIFEENNSQITYMNDEKKLVNLNKIDIDSKKPLAGILKSNSSIIR